MAKKSDSTIEVTIRIPVDEDWVELLTQHSDIFRRDHCGYWLRGIKRRDDLGWLAYEMEEELPPSEEQEAVAVAAWGAGGQLPPGFLRLDRAAAIKAQKIMVERYGLVMWENGPDAEMQDVGIQLALLDTIRYG